MKLSVPFLLGPTGNGFTCWHPGFLEGEMTGMTCGHTVSVLNTDESAKNAGRTIIELTDGCAQCSSLGDRMLTHAGVSLA